MDDLIAGTHREREEYVARLLRREQQFTEELRKIRQTIEALEEIYGGGNHEVLDDYDVIDDITPLVKESDHPLKQSEIFEMLKATVMERLKYSEDHARSNIYRALWYHTSKGPGSKFDRGVRAVVMGPEGYKIAPFRTKGSRSHYPENLIWHVSKLKTNNGAS